MSKHDYFTFRFAVLGRRRLTCQYKGQDQILYPHIVGLKNGRGAAVCYRFEKRPASPDGQWLTLYLSEVSNVLSHSGDWQTGDPETMPRTFIDDIDVQVDGKAASPEAEIARLAASLDEL